MDIPRPDLQQNSKRRRRWFVAGGSVVVAGLVVGLLGLNPMTVAVDHGVLVIDEVTRGEFVREVRGAGLLQPREFRLLVAQAAGRVERILVRPGAVVASDTIIAVLANAELENAVRETELARVQGEAELAARRLGLQSQVLDQKSRLAEVRSNYESAHLQAEAEQAAARANAVSALQAQRSEILKLQLRTRVDIESERLANLRLANAAQLRAEDARVGQLRSTAARQRQLLESLQLRAGMDGVLQSLALQVGQQIAAGAQVARVARPDALVAELRISELDARDLRPGLTAKIDTRNGVVTGLVSRVDPGVDNGSVRVEVALTGPLPKGARPDLNVDGIVEIDRSPDTLSVARPAAIQPESAASLFVLDAGSSLARRRSVLLGKTSVNRVVVSAGLKTGDRVIVSDTSQWSTRDELRIR